MSRYRILRNISHSIRYGFTWKCGVFPLKFVITICWERTGWIRCEKSSVVILSPLPCILFLWYKTDFSCARKNRSDVDWTIVHVSYCNGVLIFACQKTSEGKLSNLSNLTVSGEDLEMIQASGSQTSSKLFHVRYRHCNLELSANTDINPMPFLLQHGVTKAIVSLVLFFVIFFKPEILTNIGHRSRVSNRATPTVYQGSPLSISLSLLWYTTGELG